jgi:tRNA G18 (ribose-2'-O)-methylase SpoU
VARIEQVTRADDPRLADYVSLRDVELRKSLEGEHGLFLAEGEKVVRRAVEAGYRVRSLLMAPRWMETLRDVLEAAGDAPCYLADPAIIEGVTGFHVHRGALASMHRRELPDLADVLAGARRIVVCEDLVDHTNVGSIFRSAAALGVDGVLLSPRCADPLYRRAVKVSMGAVLTLPYARLAGWYDALTDLREAGFQVLALTPAADAVPLDEIPLGDRVALVFGAEGAGLSPRWLATSDARVTIPISRDIDSLNVSAAAAVAAYIVKRRSR